MNREVNLERKIRRRSLLLGITKSFFTLLVLGKLFYLQILQKSKYGKLSDHNRIKVKILYPERGTIFDLYNKPIATNKTDYQLSIFKDKKNLINRYVAKLSGHIDFSDRDLKEIRDNIKKQDLSDFITIKRNLSWNELEFFEFMKNKFPFLIITKEKVRAYENELIYSHVLGYVGFKKDIGKKKLSNLKVGISGIEKKLDEKLLGSDGWIKYETTSKGVVNKELNTKHAIPGRNVKTFLISEIQEKAYTEMRGIRGAVVMIDCYSGGVNCLLSSPSFNNNEFSDGVSINDWNKLLKDEFNPLLNRTIAGLYSPGSTYKLITALYALENQSFNPSKKFFCNGHISFGKRKFHCWKKEGHGNIGLEDAIKKSCDCYFYNLAKSLDIDGLANFSRKFSYGMQTGIDIPNELKGIMPNREWKLKNRGEKWQRGETLNTVIGQGFMLSTPLQIAIMTARLATGKKIEPSIIYQKKTFEKLALNQNNLEFIKKSMFKVVNDSTGTAFRSRLLGSKKMAGKTGTSQVRKITLAEREDRVLKNEELSYKLRDHSLFTCFAPFDNPRFALSVVAEHMGNGSKVAAPIAKNIINLALKKYS
tara:strand:- start:570 stop:2342 length:1773 start_codon:yes stop_codon:yes gene_type:complete